MEQFTSGWIGHLRKQEASKRSAAPASSTLLSCPSCGTQISDDIEALRRHVSEDAANHASLKTDEAVDRAFAEMRAGKQQKRDNPANPGGQDQGLPNRDPTQSEARASKKQRSPPPPSSSRSRARPATTGRQLWNPDDPVPSKTAQHPRSGPVHNSPGSSRQIQSNTRPGRAAHHTGRSHTLSYVPQEADEEEDESATRMIRQPETRPISQDQLVAEVKGIYAGLVMVEAKCIEVDNAQSANNDAKHRLNNDQWQALIALHRTLLHEHHDFFLASQHPSASVALRRLAIKYAMPARMWRHGIHSFLELLRHRLPYSLEHMLTFLYLAYSMMALLHETVPAFEDTWIECLGDLSRYRMAIEDDNIHDRDVWTGVSRHWYNMSSDKFPTTGRLYHHLAILARPHALQQLYYYAKSLCVSTPFTSARESIMTLFDPIMSPNTPRLQPNDVAFVRTQAILYSGKHREKLEECQTEFLTGLDPHIARSTKSWLQSGYFIGITIGCTLLGYGTAENPLMQAIPVKRDGIDVVMENSSISEPLPVDSFDKTRWFSMRTIEIVIRRWGDTNTLPFIHTIMVFLYHMTKFPAATVYIAADYPWKLTAWMLNHLLLSCNFNPRIEGLEFPHPEKDETPRPLPEDYAMRGLVYTDDYFPRDWFGDEPVDEDEKYFELASMVGERKERILWLGHKIANSGPWLVWDKSKREFSVTSKYDITLDDVPVPVETSDQEADDLGKDKGDGDDFLPDAEGVGVQPTTPETPSP